MTGEEEEEEAEEDSLFGSERDTRETMRRRNKHVVLPVAHDADDTLTPISCCHRQLRRASERERERGRERFIRNLAYLALVAFLF